VRFKEASEGNPGLGMNSGYDSRGKSALGTILGIAAIMAVASVPTSMDDLNNMTFSCPVNVGLRRYRK
jgi:hypothetical protein